jgi:hypothetical protein
MKQPTNVKTTGMVSGFDPDTGRHHIRYDDNDERDYRLQEKIYQFIRLSQQQQEQQHD